MAGQVPLASHSTPTGPIRDRRRAAPSPRKAQLERVSSMKAIQSIKAIQYRAYGAYAENRFVDLPAPAANDGQVLVRMHTVGINPLDNTFRSGHHYAATPENLPRVGGQMGAGILVETKSPSFKVGDRVFVTGPGFGIIADGTWRELVAAPAAGLMPIPSHIDDDHAAAFLAGAGYLTGYLVLTEFVAFKPGQSVLAPGIGGASVNLTDIIWKAAKVRGFTFRGFAPETLAAAQKTLIGYLSEGAIQPTIAKVFPLSDAADAVRHLIEDRPFGRVLMQVED